MTDTPKPVVINPSIAATSAPVLFRQALLAIGGAVTIIGFLSARDMAGLWAYLQTEEFLSWLGIACMLGSLGWGQARSLWDKADLARLGRLVPNDIAVVKEPAPPPAVDEAL